MSDVNQWDRAVEQMIQQTNSGELFWKALPGEQRHCTRGERVLGVPFRASVLNKCFLLYEYEYRHYHDEDQWSSATEIAVEIVNENLELLYFLPDVPSRWELLAAVREQTTGVNKFLEQFLDDGSGEE